MSIKTRIITDEELRRRYGEKGKDFFTFPDDLRGQMVKVHYLKSNLMKIDLIFSSRLPVDENDEILDPTIPNHNPAEFELNGYKVKSFTLTGSYWRHTNELHLTATSPKSALRVYEISDINGKDMPTNLTKKIMAAGGKIEFSITRVSEDRKTTMVYIMVTATKELKGLAIGLEV